MKRLLAVLVLASAVTAAAGQEFAASPDIKEGLSAIGAKTVSLQTAAARASRIRAEDGHRMGHSTPVVQTGQTPDVSPYSVRGVDVSHYDGGIDWGSVKAAGTAFAFIKATEGGDFVDDAFAANWRGAAGAGVARGAYHFYDFCETGAEQADNFIKTVPRADGALPMVLDLEKSDDCAKMPPKAAFLKNLAVFVRKIRAAYGHAPILYVNDGIYEDYLSGVGGGYKLWIADPSHEAPSIPGGESWAFWQYSWHGAVSGIPSETDLDVFDGDARALALLAAP